MAVQLTVDLNDQEQAQLLALIADVYPNATPTQIKTWAETFLKNALRRKVVDVWTNHKYETQNTERQTMMSDLDTDWAPTEEPTLEP